MPKVLDWQQDWPAITLACRHGNLEEVKKELAAGVPPTTANPRGATCIMLCAVYGHVTLLQELLGAMAAAGSEAEVDHQRESDGQTAYHQACFWNRKECAAALVEAGCDTGLVEKYGKVGRQLAANRKLTDMLATLDSLGAAQEPANAIVDEQLGGGMIVGSAEARRELPKPETPAERRAKAKALKAAAEIAEAAERMPLAATVAEASTGLVHAVLNEPSTGLYFIHKHVRRTAPPMAGLREEINHVRSGSQQRCMDVDDITPLVDDITSMSHITNLKRLVAESLAMVH